MRVLARQWDGVGSIPTSLLDPIVVRQWKDPSVIPNARARERLTTELAGILGRARQLGMTIGGK